MNAHSKSRHVSKLRLTLAGAGIIGVVSAVGISYAVDHRASASATTTPGIASRHPASDQTATHNGTTSNTPAPTTTTVPPPPTVTSISPSAGATNIASNATITVDFSGPVTSTTTTPTISPLPLGSWTTTGSTMTFTPTAGWVPSSTVTMSVPSGGKTTTASFVVANGSPLRLQQLLAVLGYLPVTFTPTGSTAATALADQPTAADEVPTSPVPGTFAWTYANTPASLVAQWNANAITAMTTGAVMAFESDHDMASDGVAGPAVWSALLTAVATHAPASHPYDYLMVTEVEPETLQVWSQGSIIASTLVNTGAPGAATERGTFPVFARFAVTTMRGTNPNGTKYVDPGIKYVAYFNGGDAVHEFYRSSYGWPQSNGCVELPASSAAAVWSMDPIGTLVTVS